MLTYTKSAKEGGIDKTGGLIREADQRKKIENGFIVPRQQGKSLFFILFAYLLICKFADH